MRKALLGLIDQEGSLTTTAWAFSYGAARAVLRPVLRVARAVFRAVLRVARAVLRAVLRAVRAVLRPVVFFGAIGFFLLFRCRATCLLDGPGVGLEKKQGWARLFCRYRED